MPGFHKKTTFLTAVSPAGRVCFRIQSGHLFTVISSGYFTGLYSIRIFVFSITATSGECRSQPTDTLAQGEPEGQFSEETVTSFDHPGKPQGRHPCPGEACPILCPLQGVGNQLNNPLIINYGRALVFFNIRVSVHRRHGFFKDSEMRLRFTSTSRTLARTF